MLSHQQLQLALALLATGALVSAGPCDIYGSGNTPCVAAHSSVRALYNSYNGPLYQVIRASDNKTTNISPLSGGGVANAATQDKFCANTQCHISIIYDQSGHDNHLSRAPPGGAANHADNLADATKAPVTVNGKKAYGVYIAAGTGYRIDNTSGVAKGDDPEGMYAVLDGTHVNGACCFDYGNAETNNLDNGATHMEALYFGLTSGNGNGGRAGNGPWVGGDFENGLFFSIDKNHPSPSIATRFVTAILKGKPNNYALRGGDATTGSLSTYYNGARPNGYTTMHKEGAIILGIGGDNSDGSVGTFYEGVMTSGYPADSTENAVQTNIVAAKYHT